MLQVEPGHEFMGAVTQEMEKHKTYIHRGRADIHREKAIVECFNRTLAERLLGHQYAAEMQLPEGQQSTTWVKRLPEVVSALNNEVKSLIGKKPTVAIKKNCLCNTIDILFKACWEKRKNTPLPCPSSLSPPTWRA